MENENENCSCGNPAALDSEYCDECVEDRAAQREEDEQVERMHGIDL